MIAMSLFIVVLPLVILQGFSGLGEARAGSRANSYLAHTFRGGQSDNKKSGLFPMSSTEALRSP